MANWRAVLPPLQASGWLWFNENREQHRQRPHLSLAAKSAFDETRTLHVSKWPLSAEQCNGVQPLKQQWEHWKVRHNTKQGFGTKKSKKVRVCTLSFLSRLRLSNERGIRKLQNGHYRQSNVMESDHWKSDEMVRKVQHKKQNYFSTKKLLNLNVF